GFGSPGRRVLVAPGPNRKSPGCGAPQSSRRQTLSGRGDRSAFSGEQAQGVTIAAVTPKSPAARAGLKPGDAITAVDNHPVKDFEDLQNFLSRHHPGEKLNFKVMHNGQEKTMSVTLQPRPARHERDEAAEEKGR